MCFVYQENTTFYSTHTVHACVYCKNTTVHTSFQNTIRVCTFSKYTDKMCTALGFSLQWLSRLGGETKTSFKLCQCVPASMQMWCCAHPVYNNTQQNTYCRLACTLLPLLETCKRSFQKSETFHKSLIPPDVFLSLLFILVQLLWRAVRK